MWTLGVYKGCVRFVYGAFRKVRAKGYTESTMKNIM